MKIVLGYTHKDEYLWINRPAWADEVVVLHDANVELNANHEAAWKKIGAHVYSEPFGGDFAVHKNRLNELCRNHGAEYIVQLDADESLMGTVNDNLRKIIEKYQVDLIYLPRLNYVQGITEEHIRQWGWTQMMIPMYGVVVNWPDYQGRIYKADMEWKGKVHERIEAKTFMRLPPEPQLSINHTKSIQKQEQQNAKYQEMMK